MERKNLIRAALVSAAALSASAQAALPTEATAAFTSVSGNVTDIVAAVWPILGTVTAAFALFKLFKRGVSRAV